MVGWWATHPAEEVKGFFVSDRVSPILFQGLPKELEEAAYIDGASVWRTFVSVILPLSKGPIITLGIITFLTSWNDFLWPLIILSDEGKYTLPVALAGLAGEHVQDTELMMAGSVITVLPVLIVFLWLQRA